MSPEAAIAQTHLAAQPGLSAGTLVLDGRFRVERLLGGGGMGLVYLAEQVSLGRKVALKVLREDLPLTANVGERFRREALLLSSVEHPGVVRVIDFGHHGLSACLVMELVEGESLEAVLQREAPMSIERTEAIVLQLAHGLGAIHERGIVHRDLKPDNVTLSKNTQGVETARLLDFGIARLAAPDEASYVTQVGFVLGTPEYMSPEQAMGQPLDARSDVYSLGVLAYRMLTGSHPFSGPSPSEFVSQHIHAEPRSLITVAPHLESFPRIVDVVTSMLAKRPENRPQTAQEVIGRLTAQPIPLSRTLSSLIAAHTTPPPLEGPPAGMSQAQKAGLLALAILLVVGSVSAALVWNQPERHARRLVEQGRGSEALQIIDEAGESPGWPLKMLKATALYQVGRLEDGRKLLESVPAEVELETSAVQAAADDFGRNEIKDQRPRKLLEKWPKTQVLPLLQTFARRPPSWDQWGALRFVDLQFAGQGLALPQLYIEALASKDCAIRSVAAKRLGELRSPAAVMPLEALKAQLKKPECGQDAAAAALMKLNHELSP